MDLLPNDIVRRRTLEIAENNLCTNNFSIHISEGSGRGDNYIGVLYRATFNVDRKEKDDKKNENCTELSLIIKVPPENKDRRKNFYAGPCFNREALAYNEVLPMFMRFQKSKGIIPTENGFHEIAHCFGTITDEFFEAVFLNDLRDDDFEMYNRHEYITCDHVNLMLTVLAKFHAISYAMKDQCPEKFAKYRAIEEIFEGSDQRPNMSHYMSMMTDRAIATLCPETQQTAISQMNKMLKQTCFMELFLQIVNGEAAEPYAVLTHGDCWNNNILFKYKDGHPVEARLIDWQLMRYASPICDIMYFIFLSTSKEQRNKHYFEFLDTYYNNLTSFITRLGSDPSKIISRKSFDEQLKRFGKFGFLAACFIMPAITTYAEDIPDLDKTAESSSNGEINSNIFQSERSEVAYKERMSGIIVDMVRLGYL